VDGTDFGLNGGGKKGEKKREKSFGEINTESNPQIL
jgi:hypothetical protein